MTDRHYHCVYFQYEDEHDMGGVCLLKNKIIKIGYGNCCDKIVLRPQYLLSYFLVHEKHCNDWECADRKALNYIKKVKFNDYPKRRGNING